LLIRFSFIRYLGFYISFEASLIPTLLLIIGWGYQPERIIAGMYLIFYTLGISLPLLLVIIIFWGETGGLLIGNLSLNINLYIYIGLIGAFLVKIPIFFFHLWLPKAHVEAPVSGSMVLAGILLKLGGYGVIRVVRIIQDYLNIIILWVRIGLVGGFITRIICLRQIDIKILVAYRRVGHMGIVIGGLSRGNFLGWEGGFSIIVSHGLCSSGLFCAVNIIYERIRRRSLIIGKGILNIFPSFSLWWFLLCVRNIAAPPSLNLVSEIILICRMITLSLYNILVLILLLFLRAAYSLYLYSISQHGKGLEKFRIITFNRREYSLIFFHWFPLRVVFLKSEVIFGVL
jgi:NADH-ubiquinone oxidoreductase chain 4